MIGKMRMRLFLAAVFLAWQLHGSTPETAKKIVLFQPSPRSGSLFGQAKFTYYQGRLPLMKPGTSPEDRRGP